MKSQKQYLRIFLEKQPSFQALFRSVEAEALNDYKYNEPILDLGCGDGLFAEVFFGKNKKIIGIDINSSELKEARKRGVYNKIYKTPGNNLPQKNGLMGTVFSNSVLEHIKDLDPVLKESYRVLRKGGTLIFTAPSDKRLKLYLVYRLFSFFGLNKLAVASANLMDKVFVHHNCWSSKTWNNKLHKIGFKKVIYQYKGSPKISFISDLLFIFAPLGFIEKKLFGRYLGWRKCVSPLLYFFLKGQNDKLIKNNGSVIVVEAIK
jgi:ubiquinone/menaquinone biosynthesis C-methylase UbiE